MAKEPRDADSVVVWQLRHLDDLLEPWDSVDTRELAQLVGRLKHLESLGWAGIRQKRNDKKSDHLIPPVQLCKKAQERLCALQLDDHEELLSIHITAKRRAWAVRVGTTPIARLLWWDPDHLIYETEKKNT